jgi:hypothetical protein
MQSPLFTGLPPTMQNLPFLRLAEVNQIPSIAVLPRRVIESVAGLHANGCTESVSLETYYIH